MESVKISKYRGNGAKVFTGRDNGIKARQELNLAELEKKDVVMVLIPSDTWSINPSFFGGMFEDSIRTWGDDFEKHYQFYYNDKSKLKESLAQNIESNIGYVRRSMREV